MASLVLDTYLHPCNRPKSTPNVPPPFSLHPQELFWILSKASSASSLTVANLDTIMKHDNSSTMYDQIYLILWDDADSSSTNVSSDPGKVT